MYVRFLVITVVLGIVLIDSAAAISSALPGESLQQAGGEAKAIASHD
jgi:hypothetical protein